MKYDIHEMTPDEIAASCEDAADLLEGHWTSGSWFRYDEDDEGRETGISYCIEGGLAAALGLDKIEDGDDIARLTLLSCPVYDAVLETLNHQVFAQQVDAGLRQPDAEYTPSFGEGDLPNWNDSGGRTEQEVVDLLRKTAKRVLTEETA